MFECRLVPPPRVSAGPRILTLLGAPDHARWHFPLAWPLTVALGTFFEMVSVLVYSGHHNKIPQMGWLKQQTFMFSQFWRLEVQDHGVGWQGWFLLDLQMEAFLLMAVLPLTRTLVTLRLLIRTPVRLD